MGLYLRIPPTAVLYDFLCELIVTQSHRKYEQGLSKQTVPVSGAGHWHWSYVSDVILTSPSASAAREILMTPPHVIWSPIFTVRLHCTQHARTYCHLSIAL